MKKRNKAGIKWLAIAFFASIISMTVLFFLTLPAVSIWKTKNPEITSFMSYRIKQAGEKGIRLHPRLYWARLNGISPYLIRAVLISEDDRFYQHEGFDWVEIKEAVKSNVGKKGRGGSTITQQLAKNLYLTPSRTFFRKIREAAIAVRLEKHLSKSRILEIYLNVVEWGNGVYGICGASRHYFGCSPLALSVSQSIRLASILPNPHRFHIGNRKNHKVDRKRRRIADRMRQRKWITDEQWRQALMEFGFH